MGMLKKLLYLFTAPHKLIRPNHKKKGNKILRPFKFVVSSLVIGLILAGILYSSVSGVKEYSTKSTTTNYIQAADKPELIIDIDDEGMSNNGLIGGINLLLINNITTEGFVKDYLTVVKDYSEGKVASDVNSVLPVDVVIGSSISESGTYYGTPLPKTYLPWDNSSNSPLWNKSVGGLPANATTLRNANKNVFSVDYLSYAKGPLYTDSVSIGAPGVDNSVTPFQINHFESSGYTKSILNGYNEKSSRNIDASYFPDALSALSDRFRTNVSGNVPASKGMDINYLIAMYSAQHNPGPGALLNDFLNFADVNNKDAVKAQADIFINDLKVIDDKYGVLLSNVATPGVGRAFVALALIEYCGWNYFDRYGTPDLLIQFGDLFKETTRKSASEVMSGKRADIPSYARGNAGGGSFTGLTKTSNGVSVRLDSIAMYHMWQYLYGGKYYYAKMLKYAGVDVDPTNPDTYMNKLDKEEWKPSGDSAWMEQQGISPQDIGPKRTGLLNEAHKWLGSWYGTSAAYVTPKKDANGEWINDHAVGFDCSSYMQWVYREALGIEISRTTNTQRAMSNLKVISRSEAKPGDLVYYYGDAYGWGHVGMFLATSGNDDVVMHAPDYDKQLKIATWDGTYSGYTVREYRRVEGVN